MIHTNFYESFDINKKIILVTFNRGISSKFITNELLIYLSFLKEYKKEYNIIFTGINYTLNHCQKFVDKSSIFDGILIWNIEDSEYKNWNEFTELLNKRIGYFKSDFKFKIDKVVEIGGLLNSVLKYKNSDKAVDKLVGDRNTAYINFLSVKRNIVNFFYITQFAKVYNAKFYHFIIDFQEVQYNKSKYFNDLNLPLYKRYFQYTSETFDFEKFDYAYYYYKNDYKVNEKFEKFLMGNKKFDIVSGYNVLTPDRKIVYAYDEMLKLPNSKFFINDKYRDIKNFIDKHQYLKYINYSKFTIIFPTYENRGFAYHRFVEAISLYTIPLIIEDCTINECFRDDEFDYIKENLLVNVDNIQDKIKNIDYEKTIDFLYEKYFINNKFKVKLEE